MKEGVDYSFLIPDNDPEMVHFQILSGAYKDVVFSFGKVSFEEEEDKTYLQFVHTVINCNQIEDLDSLEFKDYIGNILISIMANNTDQGIVNEHTTSNTEEFNTQ